MKPLQVLLVGVAVFLACQGKEPVAPALPRECPFAIPEQIMPNIIQCGDEQGRVPLAECVRQCELSDAKDATDYCEGAQRAFYGVNEDEMRRMYTLGCEKGRSPHCVFLSETYISQEMNPQINFNYFLNRDRIPEENFQAYLRIMKQYGDVLIRRCEEERDRYACSYIALHYRLSGWPSQDIAHLGGGYVIPPSAVVFKPDPEKAIQYRQLSCEYGDESDCYRIAMDAKDVATSRKYMACACDFSTLGERSPSCKLYEDLKAGKPLPK